MSVNNIFDHTIISLIGWAIGISAGIGVGHILFTLLSNLRSLEKKYPLLSTLIPWRTAFAGIFLLNLVPVIPVRIMGLGSKTSIASVALAIFLCAIIFTMETLQHRRNTQSEKYESISWIRSLAVLSVITTTRYGVFDDGLGFIMQQYINLLDYQNAFKVGMAVLGIAFVFDITLGCIQFFIKSRITEMQSAA